ncbi:HAD-IIIC family phosphatase [Sphaerisporangium sp. TRM90804]|uniref:HAD-IIIC family phosphatase n=1 Tax=Sphaerisporangium sp. TRM90804 TaxID=3031113 RepID=UPI00244A2DBB|nr:HAD-IIIC family phosphatase [Sphaerisporangium sp. TRM90804]MDH2428414.1 HAD-IIIC family phosphatase [Sphaerisporangium sp. TRM90804]
MTQAEERAATAAVATGEQPLIKCLVWDLDNTLWGGTLLEDENVEVTEAVRQVIIELDARGILQSVSSRNDHDHAWARLEALGLAEYFVLPRIGWGRKSDAVRAIADELNFATKTMAFVDDLPSERAEVAHHLPDVRCYTAEQVLELLGLPEFTPAVVTVDARRRREMYQAGFRRKAEREEWQGPDEDFLRTLDLVMRIGRAREEELVRVEELTLRTSQMNASGVHYPVDTLRSLLSTERDEVLVVSLTDRFGPHGPIGVMLIEKFALVWHVKLLATSCRVVSFGVGAVLLRWLTDSAARAGVHLIADFVRTDRNRMMEVAYRFAGFGDHDCACRSALPAADGVQRLHLTPARQEPPSTMRVLAPELRVRGSVEATWATS